jgi:hypothetical protein
LEDSAPLPNGASPLVGQANKLYSGLEVGIVVESITGIWEKGTVFSRAFAIYRW